MLQTENSQKRKLFDVFLPPLLTNENQKLKNQKQDYNKCFSNENLNFNYHDFKNSLSIQNSINDASLGHKDKSKNKDSNYFILSNYENKKKNNKNVNKKSVSIKRAQINIIKSRDKKMKLFQKKKKEEDYDEY